MQIGFVSQYKVIFEDINRFTDVTTEVRQSYSHIYLNEDGYRFSSLYAISVYRDEEKITNVLVGEGRGATTVNSNSVIFENDRIVFCCSNIIFCLSVPELSLLWKTKADFATCFQIFSYNDGYIVHGEVDISRIDHEGNIIWQQSGADIFLTIEGKDDFIITKDYIAATDFEYRKYKFDFDGNILES